jgi:hypothetical protein
MNIELSDEQRDALAQYLRDKLDDEKFRLSPKLKPIKEVLAMLKPAKPSAETPPALPMSGPTRGAWWKSR